MEGNGTLSSTKAVVPNTVMTLLEFPGLGVLRSGCASGEMQLEFVNNSGQVVQVQVWGVDNAGVAPDPVFQAAALPNNGLLAQPMSASSPEMGLTWMASFGQGSGLHLATINMSTLGCNFSGQATYTS